MSSRLAPTPVRIQKSTNVRFEGVATGLGSILHAVGRVSPVAASWLVEWIFYLPIRVRAPRRERAWRETATLGSIDVGRYRVQTYTWGSGPRVLLVHGWAGRGLQMGAFARPLVNAGFQVVAFDAPGHGESEGRYSRLPLFVEAMRKLEQTLGPFHGVVAHSLGAAATSVALSQGMRAKRVALVSSPRSVGTIVESFFDLVAFPLAAQEHFRRRFERRFGTDVWSRLSPDALAPRQTVRAFVIHDATDRDVPFEEGQALHAAWPQAEWMATDGLGHHRILRDHEVLHRVTQFVGQERTEAAVSE